MSVALLHEQWCIVIVVTPQNLHLLPGTLDDVQTQSLHNAVTLLAADEASVKAATSELALPVDYSLPAEIKQGSYWATVLQAFTFTRDTTVFVQAGTRLPQHWDARLAAAAQRSGERECAVSPQCVRHPFLSVFTRHAVDPQLPVNELDQWLNDYARGLEFPVPVILESCALLQGRSWQHMTNRYEDDQQLLEDLRARGSLVLATDHVYVDDSRVAYSSDVNFLPQGYRDAFCLRPPLAGVRHALTELSERRESPPVMKSCLPVQLHVGHSWGGGLGRWMEDYVAADANHNHLVLRSIGDLNGFGQTIALYRSTHMDLPIRSWTLAEPILSVNLTSLEYRRIIAELIANYSVETLVVSSLVGHSLDLLRTALPTTVVLHDYFPFCPALYATFGSPCTVCTRGDLRLCAQENPRHAYFKFEGQQHWWAARQTFIQLVSGAHITVVAPSNSVAARYRKLEPSLEQKAIHTIGHGLCERFVASLERDKGAGVAELPVAERLRIVMLGRLTDEKGAGILSAALAQLTRFADIHLLGTGDSGAQFKGSRNVRILESYRKEELGDLLREIKPDLGMLLSIVPETFSYTLSELWAAGIPVVATPLGAFADRITDGGNGWLVEPDAAALLAKLESLNSNRHELLQVGLNIARQPVQTAAQMVQQYASIMSRPAAIPLARYRLPRRSYVQKHNTAASDQRGGVLHINPQVPYRSVLAEFLRYSAARLGQSPRLPRTVRALAGRVLRLAARYLHPE